MKLIIGSDHRGFELKQHVLEHLKSEGHEVIDAGTYSPDSTDYPLYGKKVGLSVAKGESELGIVICGTGFGISLAASAIKGIKAVCCSDLYTATYTRRHNDANVLAMGAEIVGEGLACMLADTFISTKFDGGRHCRRLAMVEDIRRESFIPTGKCFPVRYLDRELMFYNQRSREWTHPYEYPPCPGGTLTNSGCGIFSLCHAIEVMSGKRVNPEELADFSCRVGGRGDDGTDRPMLLKGVVENGLSEEYGFRYDLDGHLNDPDKLWACLAAGGCALANLRKGHIVALIDCRVAEDGEKQVLAMDCHSESNDARVTDFVRETLAASEVSYYITNASGTVTGKGTSCGMFWVPLTLPMDFDLLHRL